MYLNFSQIYMESAGSTYLQSVGAKDQNARLNALQFAAKLHEISIIASMSAIMLHCVQHKLLRGDGVPLGSLLAGFQVSNPASLWGPGLWASACSGSNRSRRLSYSDATTFRDLQFFIAANATTLRPDHVDSASFPPNCAPTNETNNFCPVGGASEIIDLASPGWMNYPLNFTLPFNYQDQVIYNRYVEVAEKYFINTDISWFLTQTTPLFADEFLLAFVQAFELGLEEASRIELSFSNHNLVSAPSTFAICNDERYRWNGNVSLIDGNGTAVTQLSFPLLDGNVWFAPLSPLLDIWNSSTKSALLWSTPPDLALNNTPSIGVSFMPLANPNFDLDDLSLAICSCSLYVGWEASQIFIFYSPGINAARSILDPNFVASKMTSRVRIDADWANSVLTSDTTLGKLITAIHGNDDFNSIISWRSPLALAITILLTDALSRI
ncbi:hypothetical protein ONS96_008103 [Cadophora gregata f. sp. sojae]|nr:hypothetical protein ONS96_008103 [Cadophora gregata f. sp. sojae]